MNNRKKSASTFEDVANAPGVSLGTASEVLVGSANVSEARQRQVCGARCVLIFGFLGNILLLNDIDSNTQLVQTDQRCQRCQKVPLLGAINK